MRTIKDDDYWRLSPSKNNKKKADIISGLRIQFNPRHLMNKKNMRLNLCFSNCRFYNRTNKSMTAPAKNRSWKGKR